MSTSFRFGCVLLNLLYLSTASIVAFSLLRSSGSTLAEISHDAVGVDLKPPQMNLKA